MAQLHRAEPSLLPEGQQQSVLKLIEKFIMAFYGDRFIMLNSL